MELTLYKNFSKRKNSTKQPTGGTTIEVTLKHGTSLESPIFLLDDVDFDTNYCYALGHYYYVDDIVTVTNKLAELHCSQDVLATYKADIQGTTAMVMYSTDDYNEMIKDGRISMTEDVEMDSEVSAEELFPDGDGSYTLVYAGYNTSANVGMTSAVTMSATGIDSAAHTLYNNSDGIDTILKKWLSDPFGAISSCVWLPWVVTTAETTPVRLGGLVDELGIDIGNGFGLKALKTGKINKTIAIPWIHDDFRRSKEYTSIYIYLPFYGDVEIDPNEIIDEENLYFRVTLDNITGEIVYRIETVDHRVIDIYRCTAGVPIAVGQTVNNVLPSAGEIVAGSTAAIGGAVAGSAIAAVGGIEAVLHGALTTFKSSTTSKGGNGGFANAASVLKATETYARSILIRVVSHVLADEPEDLAAKMGRPLMAVRSLSGLTGYVQTHDASVSISGLGRDKDEVNGWLNQGIYIE